MENHKISIVVPVFNVERYLDRCLKSLTNQTYTNIEIVLIDDGSTDSSGEKCNEWGNKDKRIKVIHKENGGLGSARNRGIKESTGEYIGFVDSDDWVSTSMFERLHDLCVKYRADISCCGIKYVSSEDVQEDYSEEQINVYTQEEYALKYFKISSNETVHYAVNKLYRMSIGKKIVYPEGLIDEDVEGFIYALINSQRIVSSSQVMYYYWQNIDGISYKWFSPKQLDLLKVWKNVLSVCQKEKQEWVEYADLNRKRAYFGLLSRLALNPKEEDKQFKDIEKQLLENLKMNKKDLLRSPMPFSRKMALICMCANYQLTKKTIRFARNVYHHKE